MQFKVNVGGKDIVIKQDSDGKFVIPNECRRRGRFPSNFIIGHSPGCRRKGERKVKGPTGGTSGIDPGMWQGKGVVDIHRYTDATGHETIADWECEENCAVAMLDRQSGILKSGKLDGSKHKRHTAKGWSGPYQDDIDGPAARGEFGGDSGAASRFFKVIDSEVRYVACNRNSENIPSGVSDSGPDAKIVGDIRICIDPDPFIYQAKAPGTQRPFLCKICNGVYESSEREDHKHGVKVQAHIVAHPTQKPVALIKYLVTLVTPPGGVICDPFLGSGTLAVAATELGFDWEGIELNPEYIEIAEARVKAARPPEAILQTTF